jgi:hypothetical protein
MPRVIRDWSASQDDYHRFATLYDDQFVIGANFRGNPHTESAGSCSLPNLLKGEYHNLIAEYFGPGVLDEIRFLARVELAWIERPRGCRCQLFGEDHRTDPDMVQRLGLLEQIENTSASDGFSTSCQCRECGRRWIVTIDPCYHWTLYDWRESDDDG